MVQTLSRALVQMITLDPICILRPVWVAKLRENFLADRARRTKSLLSRLERVDLELDERRTAGTLARCVLG